MYLSDPFETVNKFSSLSEEEKRVLSHTLGEMVKCRGRECILPRFHNHIASAGVEGLGQTGHSGHHRAHKRKNGKEWGVDVEICWE